MFLNVKFIYIYIYMYIYIYFIFNNNGENYMTVFSYETPVIEHYTILYINQNLHTKMIQYIFS